MGMKTFAAGRLDRGAALWIKQRGAIIEEHGGISWVTLPENVTIGLWGTTGEELFSTYGVAFGAEKPSVHVYLYFETAKTRLSLCQWARNQQKEHKATVAEEKGAPEYPSSRRAGLA